MIGVKSRQNESVESMINRFNHVCNNSGHLSEIKNVRFYEKPSEARHRLDQSNKRKKVLAKMPIKTKNVKKNNDERFEY